MMPWRREKQQASAASSASSCDTTFRVDAIEESSALTPTGESSRVLGFLSSCPPFSALPSPALGSLPPHPLPPSLSSILTEVDGNCAPHQTKQRKQRRQRRAVETAVEGGGDEGEAAEVGAALGHARRGSKSCPSRPSKSLGLGGRKHPLERAKSRRRSARDNT